MQIHDNGHERRPAIRDPQSSEASMNGTGLYRLLASKLAWLLTPHSPIRILGTIAIAVFIGETLVMLIIAVLPPMPTFTEAFVDSSMLIVVISPALYLFLFRPIIRHIARREAAERNVRKSRDLLQTVFNGISDPLILLDHAMNVKMINTAASRYYRIGQPFAVDQPCHIALMQGAERCAECDIPRRIAENSNLTFERPGLFDPDRVEQVIIYRSAALSDRSESIIVKIADVTEVKALERQIRQRERLAYLGLLISGVAHEINNPNTFISFLPILRDYLHELIPIIDEYANGRADFEIANMTYDDFRQDLFRLIENITHGSGRIDSIVSQLKAFSHIQGRQKLAEISVGTVLERVITLADAQIKRMVKRFDKAIPAQLPVIVTDSHAIEQIVLNLLINACQAADKTDSWVSVKAGLPASPPYALAIEVGDNGCGMEAETLRHIFDPLFTTKGPDTGTGLGLYVCHNLAEGIGAAIDVKSDPGAGSTFTLLLPDLRHRLNDADSGGESIHGDVNQ